MIDPATGLEIPETGVYDYSPLVLKKYLKSRVTADFRVATNVPNPRPARLIVIQGANLGGTHAAADLVLSARRNTVYCYDATEAMVCRVAEIVRGYLIDGMYTRASGYRNLVIIGEPAYMPDPKDPANTPRTQMTVDILLRAKHKPAPAGGL